MICYFVLCELNLHVLTFFKKLINFQISNSLKVTVPSLDEIEGDSNEEDSSELIAGAKAASRAESDPDIGAAKEPATQREISNDRNIDILLLHNSNVKIKDKEYIVGAGAEYHNHGNGTNTQLSFRGGFASASSGFGLTVTTTGYGSVEAGYYHMNYFGEPMNYISAGVNASYNF